MDGRSPQSGLGHVLLADASVRSPSCKLIGPASYGRGTRNPEITHRIEDFNTRLNTQLDDTNFALPGGDIDDFYPNDVYKIPTQEDAQNGDPNCGDDDADDRPEADDIDSYDNLIGATFLLAPSKAQITLQQGLPS